MYAARADEALPKGYSDALMGLHSRAPFVNGPQELAQLAAEVHDANFRIDTAEDGIHVFNRNGHWVERDPFAFYPLLGVEHDAGHAFYLGAELARAEIAWKLGKRYAQDAGLRWGVAAPEEAVQDASRLKEPGTTLSHALRPKTPQ